MAANPQEEVVLPMRPTRSVSDGDALAHDHRSSEWASNLEENLDKKLLVLLRDGRNLVGHLRTFDEFANLLLEHTVERHILSEERLYADVYLGTMLVRGENVCLFGEIDETRESGALREAPLEVVLQREAELEAENASSGARRPTDLFVDLAD
eukprot:TRINITY_DN64042_c0_g1_i1.p3 TRINITY_DN64042_c0_g1~~TRINITY_DN64042_c0_g1_i1.p3  ORF type:complete len:153 (-),score=49.24 TRINITY_DN64042_c0_g1_i1:51-509(-)